MEQTQSHENCFGSLITVITQPELIHVDAFPVSISYDMFWLDCFFFCREASVMTFNVLNDHKLKKWELHRYSIYHLSLTSGQCARRHLFKNSASHSCEKRYFSAEPSARIDRDLEIVSFSLSSCFWEVIVSGAMGWIFGRRLNTSAASHSVDLWICAA